MNTISNVKNSDFDDIRRWISNGMYTDTVFLRECLQLAIFSVIFILLEYV